MLVAVTIGIISEKVADRIIDFIGTHTLTQKEIRILATIL
jgi:hypothetical protein